MCKFWGLTWQWYNCNKTMSKEGPSVGGGTRWMRPGCDSAQWPSLRKRTQFWAVSLLANDYDKTLRFGSCAASNWLITIHISERPVPGGQWNISTFINRQYKILICGANRAERQQSKQTKVYHKAPFRELSRSSSVQSQHWHHLPLALSCYLNDLTDLLSIWASEEIWCQIQL